MHIYTYVFIYLHIYISKGIQKLSHFNSQKLGSACGLEEGDFGVKPRGVNGVRMNVLLYVYGRIRMNTCINVVYIYACVR
jgi:hypothetical protein